MTKQYQSASGNVREKQGRLRSGTSHILMWLDRLVVVDLLLFAAAMVWKLYFFSKLLSVLYMDMNKTDAIVETGAVFLVSFWTLLLPTRGRILSLIGLNMGLSTLLFADVIYYRYFQDLISVPVLLQLNQLESLGGSISSLLKLSDFWLFVDAVVLLPFAIYILWRGRSDLKNKPASTSSNHITRKLIIRIGTSATILSLGASMFFVNVNHATDTWAKGLFERNWWNLAIYNVSGGLGYHGYDVYRYAKVNWFGAQTVTANQITETELWMSERGQTRGALENDPLFGAYAGSNVLMVQVESLQNFMIGKSIGGQEITPVLNEFMKESAYFSRFYHQTAQGRTSDADFAANCSLQPMKSGSVFIQYPTHDFQCMPEKLKEAGYSTTVFHPYQGGFWNRNVMYSNMDYDHFYSINHFKLEERVGWTVGDKSFYQQSMDVITKQTKPFYSFLITLASHHPYKMPVAEQKLDVEELEGTMMGNYLQSIHYADAAIGVLIQRMKAEGLWDNTILVVYGDHDSAIQEWEHYDRYMENTSSELEREQITKQVPLFIHLPDGAKAGNYASVSGQLDIMPTLMHLLGLSATDPNWLGSPLLTEKVEETRLVIQRNGSWTDGKHYFIPSADGLPANGKCFAVNTGEHLDTDVCLPMTELADMELMMSDRVVMGDLLRSFKNNGAIEASEGLFQK
ncbi:LTA synthase family protein [Paenibacillus sp. GSMTC-2017]|uniref:LTA synthase family protein n=1 Tax=Paenibacillus sp. GSMTC-2017 TaxID=2794350 RepID=UPI0018D69E6C|nr:LTA synthase family protein [Paenibacillus sp. GSMTC-2017]MBH5318238.1 LTA synthase family protein [Paenibacillus sp. GSMTC-2017]